MPSSGKASATTVQRRFIPSITNKKISDSPQRRRVLRGLRAYSKGFFYRRPTQTDADNCRNGKSHEAILREMHAITAFHWDLPFRQLHSSLRDIVGVMNPFVVVEFVHHQDRSLVVDRDVRTKPFQAT